MKEEYSKTALEQVAEVSRYNKSFLPCTSVINHYPDHISNPYLEWSVSCSQLQIPRPDIARENFAFKQPSPNNTNPPIENLY